MDPEVGASVLYGRELTGLDEAARRELLGRRTAELTHNTDVYGAARVMRIDDIIAPDETRTVLAGQLDRLVGGRPGRLDTGIDGRYEHRLANWPTCW
jgi:acetyl-CoA carboxylase carboxyltransferase component